MINEKRLFIIKPLIPIAALLIAALLAALPVRGEQAIYDGVLRLHVVANSDSEADQAVKLKVRDAVLRITSELLSECRSEEEAEAVISANLSILKAGAEKTLAENGFSYRAKITIGKEFYPRRQYEGFFLPEGNYISARILLGSAGGENWWCVLFPPLCTANAEEYTEKLAKVGFTPYQIKLLTESETPRYKLKFRIVELLRGLFGSPSPK